MHLINDVINLLSSDFAVAMIAETNRILAMLKWDGYTEWSMCGDDIDLMYLMGGEL